MQPSGDIFFQDSFEQFYGVIWETTNGLIDVTTTTYQPYVWGDEDDGFIKNGVLFRRGIITVHRQILRQLDDGYEIVAEGASQIIDYIQMNFPCEQGPIDPFTYHLNCGVSDETEFTFTIGTRFGDPDESVDDSAVWGEVSAGGTVSGATGEEILEWIDVWSV